MRICVSDDGYIGLSNAVLLAHHNEMINIDVVPAKVNMPIVQQSIIEHPEQEHDPAIKPRNLKAI